MHDKWIWKNAQKRNIMENEIKQIDFMCFIFQNVSKNVSIVSARLLWK